MDDAFKRCLEEGRIVKTAVQPDLIKKEIEAARTDLETAEESASTGRFKWVTVQAYYSMFHSAKALVLSKGYREKSHACLTVALKALFIDSGLLEERHYNQFRDCMNLRQDADYGMIYSEASAKETVEWAKEFLEAVARQLK